MEERGAIASILAPDRHGIISLGMVIVIMMLMVMAVEVTMMMLVMTTSVFK
jgi:hypothetical protein